MFGTEALNNNIGLKNFGIDLLIFTKTLNSAEIGSNLAIASSAFYYSHPNNNQPYVGMIYINRDLSYKPGNSDIYFEETIIHEISNILGFNNILFSTFNFIYIDKDPYGKNVYYLNSTKVVSVAKKYFNCSDIKGVPLENFGGNDTVGSHWEARVLLGEYMNGVK